MTVVAVAVASGTALFAILVLCAARRGEDPSETDEKGSRHPSP
ncbi:MAG TPA: hypothetical protein VE591_09080 [Candidatus Acidoferrum sp.]|nr:hypothetical protein [Candidatus Acidoferrum sp.]